MKSVLLFCALLLFLHLFFFYYFFGPFLAGRGTSSGPIFSSGMALARRQTHKQDQSKSIRFEIHTFLSTRKIFSFHASPKHTQREKKRRKQRERETAGGNKN